jgi:hypothetical protein
MPHFIGLNHFDLFGWRDIHVFGKCRNPISDCFAGDRQYFFNGPKGETHAIQHNAERLKGKAFTARLAPRETEPALLTLPTLNVFYKAILDDSTV